MNDQEKRYRYENDPHFNALVHSFRDTMGSGRFTPEEMYGALSVAVNQAEARARPNCEYKPKKCPHDERGWQPK